MTIKKSKNINVQKLVTNERSVGITLSKLYATDRVDANRFPVVREPVVPKKWRKGSAARDTKSFSNILHRLPTTFFIKFLEPLSKIFKTFAQHFHKNFVKCFQKDPQNYSVISTNST